MLLTGTRHCNLAAYVLLQQSRLCLSARKWDGLKKKKKASARHAGRGGAEQTCRRAGSRARDEEEREGR